MTSVVSRKQLWRNWGGDEYMAPALCEGTLEFLCLFHCIYYLYIEALNKIKMNIWLLKKNAWSWLMRGVILRIKSCVEKKCNSTVTGRSSPTGRNTRNINVRFLYLFCTRIFTLFKSSFLFRCPHRWPIILFVVIMIFSFITSYIHFQQHSTIVFRRLLINYHH